MSSPAASGWISISTATGLAGQPGAAATSVGGPQAAASEAGRLLQQGVAIVVGGVGRIAAGDRRALLDEQPTDVLAVGVDHVPQRPAELVDVGRSTVSHTGPRPTSSPSAAVASSDQHSSVSGALMPINRTVIDVGPRATSSVSPSMTSVTSHGSPGGGETVADAVEPADATNAATTSASATK